MKLLSLWITTINGIPFFLSFLFGLCSYSMARLRWAEYYSIWKTCSLRLLRFLRLLLQFPLPLPLTHCVRFAVCSCVSMAVVDTGLPDCTRICSLVCIAHPNPHNTINTPIKSSTFGKHSLWLLRDPANVHYSYLFDCFISFLRPGQFDVILMHANAYLLSARSFDRIDYYLYL